MSHEIGDGPKWHARDTDTKHIEDVSRIVDFLLGLFSICSFTFLLHSTHVQCVIDCAKIEVICNGWQKRRKTSNGQKVEELKGEKVHKQYRFSLLCFCFLVGICRFD